MATSMNTYDANGFEELLGKLPSTQEILRGEITEFALENVSIDYTVSVSLAYELSEDKVHRVENLKERTDNAIAFLETNASTPSVVSVFVMLLDKYGIIDLKKDDEMYKKAVDSYTDRS
jgi:hypothetical protein